MLIRRAVKERKFEGERDMCVSAGENGGETGC